MTRASQAPRRFEALATLLTLVIVAAPGVLIVGAAGTRFGLWSPATGFDLLVMTVVRYLAWASVAATVGLAVLAMRGQKLLWINAVVGLAVAVALLVGFHVQDGRFAVAGPVDVTTDPTDVPGFSAVVQDERRGAVTATPAACPGLQPVPRQVAPQTALWALASAGFEQRGAGPFRADGVREGFWFGFTHDVAIRIRPGRTDVRVAARDNRPGGDEACRLALRVVEVLNESP